MIETIVGLATTAAAIGGAAYAAGRKKHSRELASLRQIASGELDDVLARWIEEAGRTTSDGALCRHIAKHTNELFTEVTDNVGRESWAASMRNLLEMYETKHGIVVSGELRLGRMMLKYHSDPANHTPMPTDVRLLSTTLETAIERTDRIAREEYDAEVRIRNSVRSWSGS